MIAIAAGHILTPFETIEQGVILVDEGRIVAAGSEREVQVPPGLTIIDARASTVAPGLIDLHTHGGGGVEATEGRPETLARLATFYAQHGVTGFLAGVWGCQAHIEAGIDAVVEAVQAGKALPGAAVLGVFLEGPFINPNRAGAFPPETIVAPDPRLLQSYIDRAAGQLRLLTLAPELSGALELVRLATAHGVVCAAGHSAATWDEMQQAIEHGVAHATHTFNAMTPLHHRDPGVLGAALADDRLTAEVIVDGVHVHPGAVRILVRAKRLSGAVLITDSIAAAGMPDGQYAIEGLQITVADSSARLANGTLAGSTLTMERGVANLVAFGAASLNEALALGSLNAARVLGLDTRKGRVAPGFDADLISLDDDLAVHWTMVGGRLVYLRP
jgi:N-acetylglucosamine-6-phosphate deacetylase